MSATTTAGYTDNYSITGLLPGVYDVVVSSDDYAEQKTTATITDKDVKLNIVLTALSLRSISGTITGIGSGKTVSIIAWSATKDVRKTVFAEGTGSPVTYSISDLKPASDYVVEMSSSDYPYQVYKNKTRADEADWVDISKNNATGIDFAISSSLATISGSVVFPGDAVSGDTVRIEVFSRLKNISKGADVQFAGSATVSYQIPGLMPASDYIV
ncbi:MAG: hypothetical protein HC887_04245 [Desulfobacteraceae bacterium]|nr:hypothetical protein [Desulfobacteraceae bacterium]